MVANPITLKYKIICEIASILSYIFLKIKLSANVITFINLFLAILALQIFALDDTKFKAIGILIFFSKQILDNVDGFIARKNNSSSPFGKKLDAVCGHVYNHSILFSLAFHNYYFFNNSVFLILGICAFLLDISIMKIEKVKKNFSGHYLKNSKIYLLLKIINFDGRTMKTDFILLMIVMETFLFSINVSFLLLFIFLIPKVLRNLLILYISFI